MPSPAVRPGLAAARSAGWRAYALALLSYAPVAAAQVVANVLVTLLALVLQVLVMLALIRLVGARRPEPVPPPPQVDEQGRRVLLPPNPGPPLSPADARPLAALRNALALWRPAVSFSGLVVLTQVAALLTVVALSGGKAAEYSAGVVLIAALPVSALFQAFVVLGAHRIALEGEPRVLVATAHSVRIARTAYGLLFLITLAEPTVMALGGLLVPAEDPPLGPAIAVASASVVVAAFLQVLTTAIANEVYLRGPRLDLPADPAVV